MDNSLTGEIVVRDLPKPRKRGGKPNPITGREIDRIHALRRAGNTAVEIAVMLRRSDKEIRRIIGAQQNYGDNSPFVNELLDEVVQFITENHFNKARHGDPRQQITYNDLAKYLGYKNSGLLMTWIAREFRVPTEKLKPIQDWLRIKRHMLATDPPDRTPRNWRQSRNLIGHQSRLADAAHAIMLASGLKCFTSADRDVINSIKSRAGFPDMPHSRVIHAVIRHGRGRFYVTDVYRNSPRTCKCVWLIEHKELALLTGTGKPASTNGFKPGNQEWRNENSIGAHFKKGRDSRRHRDDDVDAARTKSPGC